MNSQLDPQNEIHELAHQTSDEMEHCGWPGDEMEHCGWPGDEMEHCGWPGDGSGMDDLADFNANEAMDYVNE